MTAPVIHKSFSIERAYPASASRVFRAHADPEQKRRWFADDKGFVVTSYSLDFQVNGFERCRFHREGGPPMTYDGVFLDIAVDRRIVFAYGMTVGGAPLSSSLSTVELSAAKGGTRLRFTEHTAFLDGNDGSASRREGSLAMLEALASELARAEAE